MEVQALGSLEQGVLWLREFISDKHKVARATDSGEKVAVLIGLGICLKLLKSTCDVVQQSWRL